MAEGIDVTIIDRLAERRRSKPSYVIGDAADRSVEAAGIEDGSDSYHHYDDNVNVYPLDIAGVCALMRGPFHVKPSDET